MYTLTSVTLGLIAHFGGSWSRRRTLGRIEIFSYRPAIYVSSLDAHATGHRTLQNIAKILKVNQIRNMR